MHVTKVKKARVVEGKCVACGANCVSACPIEGIRINEGGELQAVDQDKCIGCVKCVKVCAVGALELFYSPEQLEQLKLCSSCPHHCQRCW